jgi:hypothetical protein
MALRTEVELRLRERFDQRKYHDFPLAQGLLPAGNLDNSEGGDENRKLCSLCLSLMDRMGVELDRFGDAGSRLAGL